MPSVCSRENTGTLSSPKHPEAGTLLLPGGIRATARHRCRELTTPPGCCNFFLVDTRNGSQSHHLSSFTWSAMFQRNSIRWALHKWLLDYRAGINSLCAHIQVTKMLLDCGGLTLATHQVPKATLSLTSSAGQGRESCWVERRAGRDHLAITITGKTASTWGN